MPRTSLYAVLDLHPTASQEEIKKAFHRAALLYHPDALGNASSCSQAMERFKAITEAYSTLGNPEKRSMYDARFFAGRSGFTPASGHRSWGGGYSWGPAGSWEAHDADFDPHLKPHPMTQMQLFRMIAGPLFVGTLGIMYWSWIFIGNDPWDPLRKLLPEDMAKEYIPPPRPPRPIIQCAPAARPPSPRLISSCSAAWAFGHRPGTEGKPRV